MWNIGSPLSLLLTSSLLADSIYVNVHDALHRADSISPVGFAVVLLTAVTCAHQFPGGLALFLLPFVSLSGFQGAWVFRATALNEVRRCQHDVSRHAFS